MSRISYDLTKIEAFVFDIDGVLSPCTIPIANNGMPRRMVNIRDGYALQLAVKLGYKIAIITGGLDEAVAVRYRALGIDDIFLGVSLKLPTLNRWIAEKKLPTNAVAYVGDDIPDYDPMMAVGLPVAPKDAAEEIKGIARYISPAAGGYGVARDLIEQVLRARGDWMTSEKAFGW